MFTSFLVEDKNNDSDDSSPPINVHLADTPDEPREAVGQEAGCSGTSTLKFGELGNLFFPTRRTRSSEAAKPKPKDDDEFEPSSDDDDASSSSEDEKPNKKTKKLPQRRAKKPSAQTKKDVTKGTKKG